MPRCPPNGLHSAEMSSLPLELPQHGSHRMEPWGFKDGPTIDVYVRKDSPGKTGICKEGGSGWQKEQQQKIIKQQEKGNRQLSQRNATLENPATSHELSHAPVTLNRSKFCQVHIKPILPGYLSERITERFAKRPNTFEACTTVHKGKSSAARFLRQRKASGWTLTGPPKGQGGQCPQTPASGEWKGTGSTQGSEKARSGTGSTAHALAHGTQLPRA